MKRIFITATASLVILTAAARASAAGDENKELAKQEILKLVSFYQAAFNGSDAKAIAALYAPSGDHIGPQGERIEGRAEIEKQFAAFLAAHKQPKLSIAVTSIRLVDDNMAIVDAIPTTAVALQPGPAEFHTTLVLIRRDGRWLIESARDTLNYAPSSHLRLQPIEWLIGDWAGDASKSGGATVASTFNWAANKSFIIRKISASLVSGTAGAGTEIIGWDPRGHRIRSWDFDSDGAFGQSEWTRDGDRWIIQRTGVLPDGGQVSATYLVTQLDENTLSVQCRDRLQDGEKQPDIAAVKVKRKLPQGKAGAIPAPPERSTGLPIVP